MERNVAPQLNAVRSAFFCHFYQQHEATLEYESIGGRKYRSTITLNHHVITSYRFEEIDS
jgi:hypothetical protein